MLTVGVIGFGSIGRSLAEAIHAGKAGEVELVAVLVRNPAKMRGAGTVVPITADLSELINAHPDVIVEVAGHAALRQYGETVLRAHIDLITVSAGAFADADFAERLATVARQNCSQVHVPSGAIGGLDAIGAASLAEVNEVTHTVRKHPRAFTPEQLARADSTGLLYEGPAREGVGLFPENVNVAAAVSLGGIGLDRTLLRVYADTSVEQNMHEVRLHGNVCDIEIAMRNVPGENPKTGRIVALSVAKVLRDRQSPVVIGG